MCIVFLLPCFFSHVFFPLYANFFFSCLGEKASVYITHEENSELGGRVGRDMVLEHEKFSEFFFSAGPPPWWKVSCEISCRCALGRLGDALWGRPHCYISICIYLFFCTNISLRSISVYIAWAHRASEEENEKRKRGKFIICEKGPMNVLRRMSDRWHGYLK